MTTQIEQVTSKLDAKVFTQIRERAQHFQDDAKEALTAARHDYDSAVKALRSLRSKSKLLAYVQTKIEAVKAGEPLAGKRTGKKKAATTH